MLRRARYHLLLAAVCCLLAPGLAEVNEAHRGSNQFDRVHSFAAAVVTFSGCTNDTSEGVQALRRLCLRELISGNWQDFDRVDLPVRCPEALLASLHAGKASSSTTDCSDWVLDANYLVILAVSEDGTSCLVHGEVVPGNAHLRPTTKVEDWAVNEPSIITKTSGLRKRRSTHVFFSTIKGIGKSTLVVDGDFQYGNDRISLEVSGGKGRDVKSVLLVPPLWTVYAWIGANQREGGKPCKSGLDVSQGRFYAVTRVQYDTGETVSVIQTGSGLSQSKISIETRIEGTLPNYDDLSDPDAIKSKDFDVVFLNMNSTTLFGRANRSFIIRNKIHSYTEETTVIVEEEGAIKKSAKLHVRHLEQRRTFKKGKIFLTIEAEIEKAVKKDVSKACCDHGTARARSGKNCNVHIDACSSEPQNCCECCESGRKEGTDGKQCTSNSNKGDRLCQQTHKGCCYDAQSNDTKIFTDKPTVLPTVRIPLRDAMRKVCCVVGAARALQGESCIYLLPSLCGSMAQQCCDCCQKGIKDAHSNKKCKTPGTRVSECKDTRGLCCERVYELTTTQSPVTISSEPLTDKFLVNSFKPAGSSHVAGIVSGHSLSPISIHVGLNLSSPGQSKILCTFSKLPVDMSDQRLHLIMSIACWPFAWLLGVESSTDSSPNLFFDVVEQLEIKGSMTFDDESGEERKLGVIYKAHIINKTDLKVDLTIDGMFPSAIDAGTISLGEYKANVSKCQNGDDGHMVPPDYKVISLRNDVQINGQHFYVGIVLGVFVTSLSEEVQSKEVRLPDEQDIFIHEKKFAFDSTRKIWYLYLTSQVSTKNHYPQPAPGGRNFNFPSSKKPSSFPVTTRLARPTEPVTASKRQEPSTPPVNDQTRIFANGTFTGIINQIEFDEAELVLDLRVINSSGSIQSAIQQWNDNTAAISVLEFLPLDLPFYLLFAMNKSQMSLVSLEAEVIIDIHHIVRLTYDVTMDDSSNYPMVHVTAYGSLPHAVNSVVTLMNYQLSVIQTSPVDTFLGATSKIHVGNQTLLFTLQGKAVWKAGETDLVPGEVKISKTTPQADQERRSSRTVSVQVTLESVQSPDFSDVCCLFGRYLASGNGKCQKRDFPDVCNLKQARKCCRCCLAGHHEAINSLKTPNMCLDQDFTGKKKCKKSAMACCQRHSHISVTERVPMGHIRGILSGSVNSLPIKDSIVDGRFDNTTGEFAVTVHLGDLVHSLRQSSALLLPIVSAIAWVTACPMRNSVNGLDYGYTKFTVRSNVTFDHGDKQLYYFQAARVTRGGSLVINTMIDGDIPMLVVDNNEQLLVSNVSNKLVQVGQQSFHLVTDNYQAIISGEVVKTFSQVVTVSHDDMASSESLQLQQVDVQFSAVDVDEKLMTLTVKGNSTVLPIPVNDTLDSCCAAGRVMALSGLECPRDTKVCSDVLAECCGCCCRGLMTHQHEQKSCSASGSSSVFCKASYTTCCNGREPDSVTTLPPILLPPLPSVDDPTTIISRFPPPLPRADPCSKVACPRGQRCMADNRGNAVCRCTNQCRHATSLESCCGTDNQTYGSRCLLNNIACLLSSTNMFAYAGECNIGGRAKCKCHGYSETCDAVTGQCTACRHNTAGHHCEQCKEGYYGHPHNGRPAACKQCTCPGRQGQNNFSPTCHVDRVDGRPVCDACALGHIGRRCQVCSDGYYGRPEINGRCSPCTCSGNVDMNVFGNCDRRTGRCLKCLNNTTGDRCERCKDGYFGDAPSLKPCQRCMCHHMGAINNICNYQSGKCKCKEGVGGDHCDQCVSGYWGFGKSSLGGCTKCNCCTEGSESCSQDTGECTCKPDFTGERCCIKIEKIILY